MKEAYVYNQVTLANAFSQARWTQIHALSVALLAFQPEPQCRQAKIHTNLSIYLFFFAEWLEKHLGVWMQMGQLNWHAPYRLDKGPEDHKIAYSLGVLQGVNSLSPIVTELISHAQTALSTRSMLALAGTTQVDLPLFPKELSDELYLDLPGATVSVLKRMEPQCKESLALSESYREHCKMRAGTVEMEVASIRASAHENIVSIILLRLAKLVNQPISERIVFENDPGVLDPNNDELIIARSLAAGIAANIVSSCIKKVPLSFSASNRGFIFVGR